MREKKCLLYNRYLIYSNDKIFIENGLLEKNIKIR